MATADKNDVHDERNWETLTFTDSVYELIDGEVDPDHGAPLWDEPDWWKLGNTLRAVLQIPEIAGTLKKMKMPQVPEFNVIGSFVGIEKKNNWKKNYSEENSARGEKYQEAFFKKMKTSHAEASDFARRSQQFSALSESIENVKEKLTDAEYKAIYDAALGVHQLTVDEVDE